MCTYFIIPIVFKIRWKFQVKSADLWVHLPYYLDSKVSDIDDEEEVPTRNSLKREAQIIYETRNRKKVYRVGLGKWNSQVLPLFTFASNNIHFEKKLYFFKMNIVKFIFCKYNNNMYFKFQKEIKNFKIIFCFHYWQIFIVKYCRYFICILRVKMKNKLYKYKSCGKPLESTRSSPLKKNSRDHDVLVAKMLYWKNKLHYPHQFTAPSFPIKR